MMDEWRWIVWIVGMLVVLSLLPVLLLIPALLRMRLQPITSVVVSGTVVPADVRSWLQSAAQPLLALGFQQSGFARVRDFLDVGAEPEIHLFLRHPETGTFATLMPAQIPDHRLPCRIDLDTPLSDGRVLTTLNALGYSVIGASPTTIVHDVSCLTEEDLWTAHRERLADLGESRRLELDAFLEMNAAQSREMLHHLQVSGAVEPDSPGERFRLRLPAALRLAPRMSVGNAARERFLAKRGREITEGRLADREVELWQEVAGFLRTQRALRNPISGAALTAILVVSGATFVLGMSLVFGPVTVWCLLGVVAFHEFGHYAAMRLFGYEGTSVFFVPFLGAATTGRKPDVTLSQEMVVLMAGPVPGIAMGTGLVLADPGILGSAVGSELVAMLIGINLLNLLPVLPLDGGKVIERILLAGRPWASLLVGSLGIAGFTGLAVWAEDPILIVFCALFALSLRSHFRGMRLLERVKATAFAAASEEDRAGATFKVLAGDQPRSFVQKVQLARLVESHWIRPRGGRAVRFAWLMLYGVFLTGALGGSILAIAAARSGASSGEVDFAEVRSRWLDPGGTRVVSCDDSAIPPAVAAIDQEEHWQTYVLLVCRSDPASITHLNDELDRYATLDASLFCLRPPWRMDELSNDMRDQIERRRAMFNELVARDDELLDSWRGDGAVGESTQLAETRLAASEGLRIESPPRDAGERAVFELFEQWYLDDAQDQEYDPATVEPLGRSLRRCPDREDLDRIYETILAHSATDGELRVAFQMNRPMETFRPLVKFLCSAGCSVEGRVGFTAE